MKLALGIEQSWIPEWAFWSQAQATKIRVALQKPEPSESDSTWALICVILLLH